MPGSSFSICLWRVCTFRWVTHWSCSQYLQENCPYLSHGLVTRRLVLILASGNCGSDEFVCSFSVYSWWGQTVENLFSTSDLFQTIDRLQTVHTLSCFKTVQTLVRSGRCQVLGHGKMLNFVDFYLNCWWQKNENPQLKHFLSWSGDRCAYKLHQLFSWSL